MVKYYYITIVVKISCTPDFGVQVHWPPPQVFIWFLPQCPDSLLPTLFKDPFSYSWRKLQDAVRLHLLPTTTIPSLPFAIAAPRLIPTISLLFQCLVSNKRSFSLPWFVTWLTNSILVHLLTHCLVFHLVFHLVHHVNLVHYLVMLFSLVLYLVYQFNLQLGSWFAARFSLLLGPSLGLPTLVKPLGTPLGSLLGSLFGSSLGLPLSWIPIWFTAPLVSD